MKQRNFLQKIPAWLKIVASIFLILFTVFSLLDHFNKSVINDCEKKVKIYSQDPSYRNYLDGLLNDIKIPNSFEAKREYVEPYCDPSAAEFGPIARPLWVKVWYGTNIGSKEEFTSKLENSLNQNGWRNPPTNTSKVAYRLSPLWDMVGGAPPNFGVQNFSKLKKTEYENLITKINSELLNYEHLYEFDLVPW